MAKKVEFCNICGENIGVYLYKTVIVGSGCAGLNCADSLYDLGNRSIAIVTNGLGLSTSINTGSDKQTYYKLSTAGSEADSVYDMAQTLFSGGAMQGYHSLTEAAMSLRCFYKLISLGVDFPKNSYGEYVGYRTDHDLRRRATSCGPLTSKFMAEALIDSVKNKDIDVHEGLRAARLIVDDGQVRGVICIDEESGAISVFMAPNIVLATGGPAGIYSASVYPECHNGALGLAMEAGCSAVNLTEWQYGIASTDFRWNLSGSYMQVIPRFVSVDSDGVEREFLHEYIGNERYTLIFQKGYNWPFCPTKLVGENKCSLIDLAVYRETCKGRRVYLDFTKNDSGFSPELLSEEARGYLQDCGVLDLDTPLAKLRAMNERAYKLYYDKAGIDLSKEALAINVCAQHCNGGIECDRHYMTSIDGLYAVGECAGVFGIARPGGTALNSTQVSSMCAAEHISEVARGDIVFNSSDKKAVSGFAAFCQGLTAGNMGVKELISDKKTAGGIMSKNASFVRIPASLQKADDYMRERIMNFPDECGVSERSLLSELLIYRDILISARCVLAAMIKYADEGFLSRGSYLVAENENMLSELQNITSESDKETIIRIRYENNQVSASLDKVAQIPQSEQWFEKVYNNYYK